jgi:hypothetical protein
MRTGDVGVFVGIGNVVWLLELELMAGKSSSEEPSSSSAPSSMLTTPGYLTVSVVLARMSMKLRGVEGVLGSRAVDVLYDSSSVSSLSSPCAGAVSERREERPKDLTKRVLDDVGLSFVGLFSFTALSLDLLSLGFARPPPRPLRCKWFRGELRSAIDLHVPRRPDALLPRH